MAVTITSAPAALNSVFAPIAFEATSDNAAAELKIRCKVSIRRGAGSAWEELASFSKEKQGDSSAFRFEIQPYLNAAMNAELPNLDAAGDDTTDTGTFFDFRVDLTERVFDADGTYTDGDTIQSAVFQVLNCIIEEEFFEDLDNFKVDPSGNFETEGRFLTDRPTARTTVVGRPEVISYLGENEGGDGAPVLEIIRE